MLSYFIFSKTAKECRFLPYHILQANVEKCLGKSSAASITNIPPEQMQQKQNLGLLTACHQAHRGLLGLVLMHRSHKLVCTWPGVTQFSPVSAKQVVLLDLQNKHLPRNGGETRNPQDRTTSDVCLVRHLLCTVAKQQLVHVQGPGSHEVAFMG